MIDPFQRSARPPLPRAESCDLLRLSALKLRVAPGADSYVLGDGTLLVLLWVPTRGRGVGGLRLLAACPVCGARVALLRRPPGGRWACWRCQPVSFRSHRRSGAPKGKRKPRTWRLAQIADAQARLVRLLGLAVWPPASLWGLDELRRAHRKPDASAFSPRRRDALERRLDALETLRIAELAALVDSLLLVRGEPDPALAGLVAGAKATIKATRWAVRRQAHDPRTRRRLEAVRVEPYVRAVTAEPH